jgi:CheY-like chemotaxis protein
MPEMDGFAVAAEVARDPELAGSRLMLLTSAGQRGDAARCRALGVVGDLTKPITSSELWDAVVTAIGTPAPGSGSPEAAAPATLVTRHALRESRRRLHVLVAEDNPVNQRLAVRLLEKQGHTTVVVGDGRLAVEAFEREGFDLVLMDVQMPELDGFAATVAIRARERTTGGHTPIVAMTAHAMKGDEERCLAAGMDGYLSKPVKVETLLGEIARLVS